MKGLTSLIHVLKDKCRFQTAIEFIAWIFFKIVLVDDQVEGKLAPELYVEIIQIFRLLFNKRLINWHIVEFKGFQLVDLLVDSCALYLAFYLLFIKHFFQAICDSPPGFRSGSIQIQLTPFNSWQPIYAF